MAPTRRRFDDAIVFAQKAVAMAPNESLANFAMGSALIVGGKAKEAIQFIDESIKLDPQFLDLKLGGKGVAYFILGEYEKAAELIQRSLTLNPALNASACYLAASYAYLGQMKKAEDAWRVFKDGFPEDMVPTAHFMYWGFPYKNQEIFDRLMEGIIKAGFSGDPSDYCKLKEQNKLSGQEISDLLIGKTMIWHHYNWKWGRDKDGNLETPNPYGGEPLRGKSWIEADELCDQYDMLFDGTKYCMDIYKNQDDQVDSKCKYLASTDFFLIPFSVEELK